jgi:hypothetical protein
VVTGSDFEMTEDIPSREACCSTYWSPKALYIISGTLGSKRFSARAASRPFITGIDMSKTTKSGCNCCAFSIRFASVFRLPAYIEILFTLEHVAERLTDVGIVVHD